jgi:hypothetical protein
MPAGYEGGLRIVENHLGRASASKQVRGNFPKLAAAPSLNAGRVIRKRDGIVTGSAAMTQGAITAHGVRPSGEFQVFATPEDMLLPMMAFFHNRKYTVVEAQGVSPDKTEIGTFQYGMVDSKPDHEGIVIGTYNDAAANYAAQVAMSDAYSISLERLYGHGDLGDTDNGLSIDNFVVNRVLIESQRGIDQSVLVTFGGFGRAADEQADFAEATWGPGLNGDLSTQSILTPDKVTLQLLDVNSVDKISVYDDWMDSISIEMVNGLAGRDALGFDEFNALATEGRPGVKVKLGMAHVASDFLAAMIAGQKIALTARFSNSANERMDVILPNLRIAEGFAPNPGDANSDASLEVPLEGTVDTTVASPLAEVSITTEFDVRTNTYFSSTSLSVATT